MIENNDEQQTVSVPVEPVVSGIGVGCRNYKGELILNHTKRGEITYNTNTKEYTVWDEVYCDHVCVTNYPKVAEAALRAYAEHYLDG